MKLKNWAYVKHKNTEEKSLILADKVEYIKNKKGDFFDHHLMFYSGGYILIFKVWLKNGLKDKPYKNVKEACRDVGITIK